MSDKQNKKEEISNFFSQLREQGFIMERTEDDMNQGFSSTKCKFDICDGSGYILIEIDGKPASKSCDCYKEEVFRRKLKKAKIERKYWNSNFKLEGVNLSLLHPKKEVPERTFKGKKPANPKPETPREYIDRAYKEIPIKKGAEYFAKEYTQKSLEFLTQEPRSKVKNLMLMGEPGMGKTFMASAIGKYYIKQGKTVYFTTMLKLVSDVLNPEVNIREIVTKTDLLIVDEVGYEYHTDTKWALKQIKELFRIRYNSHLPIVCTTNFYPNELNELYDASLMSMFNGSYFFVLVERDNDYRLDEADASLDDFSFVEDSDLD